MGQALLRLCAEQEGCQVVAAVATRVGQRVVDGVPWFTAAELGGVPEGVVPVARHALEVPFEVGCRLLVVLERRPADPAS